jgi:hypothetical protein
MGTIVRGDRHLWERDDIQFPRLLAEIKAAGLSYQQLQDIALSMDLPVQEVLNLLDRAEETWEAITHDMDCVDERCVSCHHVRGLC